MKLNNLTLVNRPEIAVLAKLQTGISDCYPYNPINTLIEVDAEFNRKSFKIENWKGETEYKYRLLCSETDSLANWQSRNNAVGYIGETGILLAEKQVRKNLANLKKEFIEASKNPSFLQLKEIFITENDCKYFQDDFYYHDCLSLHRYKPDNFLWLVRNSGTWIIFQKNIFNDVIIKGEQKEKQHRIYWYKNGTIKRVCEDLDSIYNRMPDIQTK